jgi:hypothetical protein
MVGGAPEFEGEMMDTRFKSAKVVLVKVRSELGAFAPPLRPPDPVGGTSGLHDGPLIGRTERLGETGQCGLDEPRLEGHPCGLAIGIKFLGHSHWWRKLTASSGASGFRNFREPLTFLSNIRELTRV